MLPREQSKYLRAAISVIIGLAALAWAAPWGLYELGLLNIDGRPSAPAVSQLTSEDDALLRREFRVHSPISVTRLSPWSYFASLVVSDSKEHKEESGVDAAWLIARQYNASHLKDRRTIWWHLSGAALTIWITRNWSPIQVLSRAAELARHLAPRRAPQHAHSPSRADLIGVGDQPSILGQPVK